MEFAEIYLKLTGPSGAVDGDCQAEGHKDEIELFDWGWGLRLEDLPADKDGNDTGKVATADTVRISKAVDKASTTMMTLLNNGATCPEAILALKQSTQKAVVLKLVLKNVRLESYTLNVDCSDMEVELGEDWTLAYDEVKVQYSSAARTGGTSSFLLKLPPGIKQEDPVQQATPVAKSSAKESSDGLDKADVIKLVEEQLKKLKLLK